MSQAAGNGAAGGATAAHAPGIDRRGLAIIAGTFAIWGVVPGPWAMAGAAVVMLAGVMSQRSARAA